MNKDELFLYGMVTDWRICAAQFSYLTSRNYNDVLVKCVIWCGVCNVKFAENLDWRMQEYFFNRYWKFPYCSWRVYNAKISLFHPLTRGGGNLPSSPSVSLINIITSGINPLFFKCHRQDRRTSSAEHLMFTNLDTRVADLWTCATRSHLKRVHLATLLRDSSW